MEFQGDAGQCAASPSDADISSLIGTNPSVAVAETQLGVRPDLGQRQPRRITFTPPLGTGTYADDAALTFKPQQINIKIGEGNLTYTEHRDYTYLLDRGWLDTVREPKDVPMDVKLDAVYEHIVSDTGEHVCPMEALKGGGSAAEWVSSSPDQCEPYCIDLVVDYDPPCAPAQSGDHAVPDVPGRDPRDQLQRGDHRVDGQVQGQRARQSPRPVRKCNDSPVLFLK